MMPDYKTIAFEMLEARFMNYIKENGDNDYIADMLLMAHMGKQLKTQAFASLIGSFLVLLLMKPAGAMGMVSALEDIIKLEAKKHERS